jgi:phage antirepressor YoqD-like protein
MSIVKFNSGDTVTMTTLELVNFINSQREEGEAILDHADLMKKVPKVLKKDAGKFSDIYLDSMNRRQKCYRFAKREACLVAMSYSYDLQASVYDYMTELEQKLQSPQAGVMAALSDPAVLKELLLENVGKVLALTADNQELSTENLALEQKVAADASKVEFHDHVVISHDVHYVRDVAQSLGTGQNTLFRFMRFKGWVDRFNTPYQDKIRSGYLVAEPHSYKDKETGERKTKFTCRVTGKGFTKLQALWKSRNQDLLEVPR